MKLTPDKLPAQLSKGLASVYFVTGDEPLIVGETIDAIRLEARRQASKNVNLMPPMVVSIGIR